MAPELPEEKHGDKKEEEGKFSKHTFSFSNWFHHAPKEKKPEVPKDSSEEEKPKEELFLHRLFDVCNDVVDIFYAYRQTN